MCSGPKLNGKIITVRTACRHAFTVGMFYDQVITAISFQLLYISICGVEVQIFCKTDWWKQICNI